MTAHNRDDRARPDADPRTTDAPAQPPAETASGQNTLPRAPAGAPSEPSTADHLAPAQQPGELGRLGPYRVLGVLGAGGMGVVYKAEEPALKRTVALKVMLPECAANEHARRRFLREAEAQAAVEHEHIIPIYQVGEADGVPYIAMPLLKGLTLSAALKQNSKPPLAHVVRIARETAEGLAAAHDAGLMHRDIKPGNIWLEGKKLKVRILDFGLARAEAADPAADPDGPLTATGAIVGTPAYMSPEQARGGPVDARTDLFSLGVVLYQMLTGAVPFKGPNALAILTALAVDDPPPVRAANPAIPERLERLVAALLSKAPDGRPASAETAADELRAIEDELTRPASYSGSMPVVVLPVPATRDGDNPWEAIDVSESGTAPIVSGILRRGGSAPVPAPEDAAPVVPDPRRARPWALLAAALLVLVAGSAFVAYKLVYDTPQGALVVEIDDPDVEARFKNGELKLFDKSGKLLYTLKPGERDAKLPAGQYKIEVTGTDGLKLDTPEFKLERDGKAVVRVTLDKRPVAKKDPPKKDPVVDKKDPPAVGPATDPHRRAAEMIVTHGGTVEVRTAKERKSVKRREDLPNEPFVITYVSFLQVPIANDALQSLEGLSYLESLVLNGSKVTDEGIKHLHALTVWNVDLGNLPITDKSTAILSAWPELNHLQIHGTRISDAAIPHLLTMRHLRDVHLGGTKITDAGVKDLSAHPSLRKLILSQDPITPAGLAHLKELKTLQWLTLSNFRDDIVESLKSQTQLRLLELFDPYRKHSDETGKKLQQALPNTAILHKAIPPTDAETKAIQWALDQKASITTIYNSSPLKEVPTTAFYVNGLSIPGNGPKSGAKNLRGIRYIQTLRWGNLKDADAEAEHLATLDTLIHLGLVGSDLTAKGLEKLTAIRSLEQLHAGSCSSLTDEAMVHIPKFKHLWLLALEGCPITDVALESIGRAAALHTIELDGCSKITGSGLKHLAALPVLRELNLKKTSLDDTAVPHLKLLTQVRILELQGTKLTAAGIAELQKALPKCAIFWDGGLVVPGAAPIAVAPADPDRALAEWVISKGGGVWVTKKNVEVRKRDELPAEPFQVLQVIIHGNNAGTDADLEHFRHVKSLWHLTIYPPSNMTDAGLEKLSGFPCAERIANLGISSPQLTDAGFAHLPRFKSLNTLSIMGKLGDAGADVIAKLPNLTTIGVVGTPTTDSMLAKWVHHPLKDLNLSSTKVTDEGMKAIRDKKTITALQLKNTAVSDAGLAHLADWTQLTHLHLSGTKVTRASLPVLAKFTSLRQLNLGSLALTDADVAALKPLQKLVMLYLNDNRQITDKALDHLLVFPSLQTLYLEGTSLTDTGLTTLAKIPTLKLVALHGTKVTAAGVAALRKALPECDVQWDGK